MNELITSGYLIHRYRYRETSVIADCFTETFGRQSFIVKGVMRPKSPLKNVLQPFCLLQFMAKGRSSLKTLVQVDHLEQPLSLHHHSLVAGLYLNELLFRLLPKEEPEPELFKIYQASIQTLAESMQAPCLRQFEKQLIHVLGYQLGYELTADTHQPIVNDHLYQYIPEYGFILSSKSDAIATFSGEILLSIARNDFSAQATQSAAKRLFRSVLTPLLGKKPLQSRLLMQALQ